MGFGMGSEGGGAGGAHDVSSTMSPFGPATGKKGLSPDAAAVTSVSVAGKIADVQDQTTAGVVGKTIKDNALLAALPLGVALLGAKVVHSLMTTPTVDDSLHPGNPNADNVGASTEGHETGLGNFPSATPAEAPPAATPTTPTPSTENNDAPAATPPETPPPTVSPVPDVEITTPVEPEVEEDKPEDEDPGLSDAARAELLARQRARFFASGLIGQSSLLSAGYTGFTSQSTMGG